MIRYETPNGFSKEKRLFLQDENTFPIKGK